MSQIRRNKSSEWFNTPPILLPGSQQSSNLESLSVGSIPRNNESSTGSIGTTLKSYTFRSLLVIVHTLLLVFIFTRATLRRFARRIGGMFYVLNRSPELIETDVSSLSKLPKTISFILQYRPGEQEGEIDDLMESTAEIAAWTISAGIRNLVIYEKTGQLSDRYEATYAAARTHMNAYFNDDTGKKLRIHIPQRLLSYPEDAASTRDTLNVFMLSEDDGKEAILELARTMVDLGRQHKLTGKQVTVDSIGRQLETVVCPEPDLLILFSPRIDLNGFPPWQLRWAEIFHLPDNAYRVDYSIFLSGLQRYSYCKINFGK